MLAAALGQVFGVPWHCCSKRMCPEGPRIESSPACGGLQRASARCGGSETLLLGLHFEYIPSYMVLCTCTYSAM